MHAPHHVIFVYRKVLELDSKVLEIARELYEKRSLLIMGRGFNFATCLEGALKVERKGDIERKLWALGEKGREFEYQCPNFYTGCFQLENKLNSIVSENDRFHKEIYGRGFNFATCLEGAIKVERKGGIKCKLWALGEGGREVELQGALWQAIPPQHGWRVEGLTSPPRVWGYAQGQNMEGKG
jgi:hypothetical protein